MMEGLRASGEIRDLMATAWGWFAGHGDLCDGARGRAVSGQAGKSGSTILRNFGLVEFLHGVCGMPRGRKAFSGTDSHDFTQGTGGER